MTMQTYDQRGDHDAAHDLVRRRINQNEDLKYDQRRSQWPTDLRDAFKLRPIIREQDTMSMTGRYRIIQWGVFICGSDHSDGYVSVTSAGQMRFLAYGRSPAATNKEMWPQRTLCKYCDDPLSRTGDAEPWLSLGRNPECESAPNPDDGPMPGHTPGTAIMSPPAWDPSPPIDPAALPKPVVAYIPRRP